MAKKLPSPSDIADLLRKNPALRQLMTAHPGLLEVLESATLSGEQIQAIAKRLQHSGANKAELEALRKDIVEAIASVKGNVTTLRRVTYLAKQLDKVLPPPQLHFDDLINPAEVNTFRYRILNELYQRYLKKVGKTAADVDAKQWAKVTDSGYAKALFRLLVGEDWYKHVGRKRGRLIPIHAFPLPRWPEQDMQRLAALFNAHISEVTSKLGKFINPQASRLVFKPFCELSEHRLIPEWIINVLKGKMAEVLCHEHMLGVLKGLDKTDKNLIKRLGGEPEELFLCKDMRYDFLQGSSLADEVGELVKNKEFTDGMIIARMKDGGFKVVHIFEVKAGREGAEEARAQVFKNRESLDDVTRISNVSVDASKPDAAPIIGAVYRADGSKVEGMALELTYDRGKPKPNTVSGLFTADKTILAAADELADLPGLNLSQAEQTRLAAFAKGEDVSIDDIMARISRHDDRNTLGITSINPIRSPDGTVMTRTDLLHLAAYLVSQNLFVNVFKAAS